MPRISFIPTRNGREFPQHIHGGGERRGGVLKLGNPATQDFVLEWLSEVREWSVDIYREDLGIGQPPEEGADRTGIAEMHHVEGFYRVWSELLHRFPRLSIDNCCGGGRRIDLETCAWLGRSGGVTSTTSVKDSGARITGP